MKKMIRGKYNKRIIELVKNQPILYDTTHPQYKNSFMTYKVWNQLGAKMNMSAKQLKQKWKNIRDCYFKHLKSIKAVAIGQKPMPDGRYLNWPWASDMEFLKDHIEITIVPLPTQPEDIVPETVFMESESDNDRQITEQKSHSEASASIPTPPTSHISIGAGVPRTGNKVTNYQESTADKVISYLQHQDNKLSSIEHLMIGYAKTMDMFSERRKILTKMKIAQVMMEAELEEEQERSETDSHRRHSYADPARSHPTHFTAEQNPHEHFMCEDSGIKPQISEL